MAVETIYQKVNDNGVYSCGDIGISADEWFELLKEQEAKPYLDTLFCFLREPDHAGTCSTVSKKYGNTAAHHNAKVSNFAKWVQKKLDRFQVVGTDGSDTYWCIPMQKGWDSKQGFVWQLRDELVAALRNYLLKVLIIWFRDSKKPFNGYNEEYKWALLDQTEGKGILDIIKSLKGVNLVHNALTDPAFKFLWENKPTELTAVVEHLFDESKPIDDRIAAFKTEMKSISPSEWKFFANDERIASALLMCKYPDKYTAYKDEIYKLVCQYFGFEIRKVGKKFSHFMEIINGFVALYGEKTQEAMMPQISKYKNKPLNLAIQTLLWCMRESMKPRTPNSEAQSYWLAGYSFGGSDSQLERFIKDGIWEGGYKDNEINGPKLLDEAKAISEGDIIILKSTSVKGTNHDQPFLRIKAVGVVKSGITVLNEEGGVTKFRCSVDYINKDEKDFDGSVYGAYRRTLHRADSKVQDIIDYVNGLLNNEPIMPQPQQKYKEYIELLKEVRNLVLTGAPGTGKTFMAQAIASEMDAVPKFVQFHPSYDYTDFVEGLRPVGIENGQPVFERKDGVFKEFCRQAIRNLVDSEKSIESLAKEMSWQDKLDRFVEEAIENETKYKLVNGNEFTIIEMKGHSIVVHNEQNEKTTEVSVNADEILELLTNEVPLKIVRDIRNYFNRKFGTQPDSYAFVITNAVRAMKQKMPVVAANKIDRKPFVFIIDEINRGEASKIFGELFYAIDPGYRDKKDILVQTQYQNLVPETDVFAKGFYVPENVYILATMNDIDRSVESMDFAMRRRFTWHEVKPSHTEYMLNNLPCADEAKERMHHLNDAIAETDGLGPAYMIGPAYFKKLEENGGDFDKLWLMNIEPLLREYLRGFRKTDEILDKFRKAYYGKDNETVTDSPLLEDED